MTSVSMQMHTPAQRLPQIEPNFMEYWNIILLFHFATRQRLIRAHKRFAYEKKKTQPK